MTDLTTATDPTPAPPELPTAQPLTPEEEKTGRARVAKLLAEGRQWLMTDSGSWVDSGLPYRAEAEVKEIPRLYATIEAERAAHAASVARLAEEQPESLRLRQAATPVRNIELTQLREQLRVAEEQHLKGLERETALRTELADARARLAEADNVICWGVDCLHQAKFLDASYAAHCEAEKTAIAHCPLPVLLDEVARRRGAEAEALPAIDSDALELKARAATPGDWRNYWVVDEEDAADAHVILASNAPNADPASILRVSDGGTLVVGVLYYDGHHVACTRENAEHITAANPKTLLALIARLRAAEARMRAQPLNTVAVTLPLHVAARIGLFSRLRDLGYTEVADAYRDVDRTPGRR